jgi:hypothetical protein
VEGFTSLFWVLICGAAVAVAGRPEPLLVGFSVSLVALTQAELIGFLRRDIWPRGSVLVSGGTVRALALALLAWTFLSPTYVVWSTLSLMETPLWGLILAFGTISAARGVGIGPERPRSMGWGVASWVAAALVTRPEGMLMALVWILVRGLALLYTSGSAKEALQRSIVPGTAYAVTMLGLVAFRLSYFGYPLPNTYYAKVSPSVLYNLQEGLKYLMKFLLWQILIVACLGAALAFVADCLGRVLLPWRARSGRDEEDSVRYWRARMFVFSFSLLAGVVAPVPGGGDIFAYFRFYQPLWPMLPVPLAAWLAPWMQARTVRSERSIPGALAAGFFSLGIFLTAYLANNPRWDRYFTGRPEVGYLGSYIELAAQGRAVGDDLNRVLGERPAESLGVIAAGGVAVTYRGPILDLLGLNNVAMGHSPGDRRGERNHACFNEDVFYKLSPDLVVPWQTDDVAESRRTYQNPPPDWVPNKHMRGMLSSKRFWENYVPVFLPVPGKRASVGIVAYSKPAVVDRLRSRGVNVAVLAEPAGDSL